MPIQKNNLNRTLSVAPMMDWTDRHERYFLRVLSKQTLLYTEMVTTGALLHGDRERFLAHHPEEYPLAIQLGGSEPDALASCAEFAEQAGYHEVNLNVGCPSDRVQNGRFGACLMAEPKLVADCVAAMKQATTLPVTVKTRIGIDELDSYQHLKKFVHTIQAAGCETFIVHARKAWLKGLSPKQNREIPPLNYERVFRLKQDFPELEIILNGGVQSLDQVAELLPQVDGVMLGRAAYQRPYLLAEADHQLFGISHGVMSRHDVVRAMYGYIEAGLEQGVPLASMTRHMLGLFHGCPGAKSWRRYLSQNAYKKNAGLAVIERALSLVPEEAHTLSSQAVYN